MKLSTVDTWHRLIQNRRLYNQSAVLEFEVEIDGIIVNGADMIKWDGTGRITEFKVMIRPLKAINLVHQKMRTLLKT